MRGIRELICGMSCVNLCNYVSFGVGREGRETHLKCFDHRQEAYGALGGNPQHRM